MEELIKSVRNNPESWSITQFCFVHSCGFKFWIRGGFISCGPHESGMHMTFMQHCRMWRAYRWWCHQAPIEKVV